MGPQGRERALAAWHASLRPGATHREAEARRYAAAPIPLAPVRSVDELSARSRERACGSSSWTRRSFPARAPADAAGPGIRRAEHYALLVAVRP